MNEDNKTIAANICREHAKNYGGPATPAITVSAIVSELDKRDSEISLLRYACGWIADVIIKDREIRATPNEQAWIEKGKAFYRDTIKENAALKSKLGEAEKVLASVDDWFEHMKKDHHEKLIEGQTLESASENWDKLLNEPLDMAPIKALLSSLRSATKGNLSTASDGEGKKS